MCALTAHWRLLRVSFANFRCTNNWITMLCSLGGMSLPLLVDVGCMKNDNWFYWILCDGDAAHSLTGYWILGVLRIAPVTPSRPNHRYWKIYCCWRIVCNISGSIVCVAPYVHVWFVLPGWKVAPNGSGFPLVCLLSWKEPRTRSLFSIAFVAWVLTDVLHV